MTAIPILQRLAAANADGPVIDDQGSSFHRHVLELLDRVEYRRCDQAEDMEQVYRLRYKAYVHSGMINPSLNGMIYDAMDDVSNAMCFGIYIDGDLVSTLRMHHASAAHPVSPSTSVFGDIILPRIAQGKTFIDTSRFAADPELGSQFKILPYVAVRLVAMACVHSSPDFGLLTIRPDHAAFYRRVFHADPVGPLRSYPALNHQVVLYQTVLDRIADGTLERYPFFRSTRGERRLMFGETPFGEASPLTVLPTAKYMMKAA